MHLLPAAALLTSAALASAAPTYRVTDLHTTDAIDLTADGTVYTQLITLDPYDAHPAAAIRNGKWSTLAIPAGSRLVDVSDHGTLLVDTPTSSFVQFKDGTRRVLHAAAGASYTGVDRVNDRGQAVGAAFYGHAFSLVDWNGVTPTLPHVASVQVEAFNNNGVSVIGQMRGKDVAPSLVKGGVVTPLPAPAGNLSFATDVNDSGVVVGATNDDKTNVTYAAVWTAKTYRKIAPLAGNGSLLFSAINGPGWAVGTSFNDATDRATVWDGSTLYDLNTLLGSTTGVTLQWASDINNAGQILAVGDDHGRQTYFLLTPTGTAMTMNTRADATAVPEPGCLVIGVASALLRRRRPAPLA